MEKKENKGITLIALVITIIVMLILVTVTIQVTISGGIFQKAGEAIIETEIAREKEILNIASITAKINDNWILSQENLQNELDSMTGNTDTKVEDMNDGSFLVVFPSKRVYEVEEDGSIEYLGKEGEIDKVVVTVDKESDLSDKQVQEVEITIKNYNVKENEKVTVQYAWNTDETIAPSVYENAQFEDEDDEDDDENEEEISISRTTIIDSGDQTTGYYYLWIKVKVGNKVVEKKYGQYYIGDYMTLVNTSKETTAESGFLGNTEIPRGRIKSITIKSTTDRKTVDDENCWDVGTKKDGIILAWYEEEAGDDGQLCYKVTIGQEGGVVAHATSVNLFRNIGSNLNEEIKIEGLENLITKDVTSMRSMFAGCSGLKKVNLNELDTSSVYNMNSMFSGCSGLTRLDLNSLETGNVVYMRNMFSGCSSLTDLMINELDTSSVLQMDNMFRNCSKLTHLDLEGLKTENVESMRYMFINCLELEELNLTGINTGNVTNMSYMFYGCKSLENLDVSGFDTKKVKNMSSMFRGCQALKDINLESFNTENVSSFYAMFHQCNALIELDLSNFNIDNAKNISAMFSSCRSLTSLRLNNWTVNSMCDADSLFSGVPNDCKICVSTNEMADWVKEKNNKFINVYVEAT